MKYLKNSRVINWNSDATIAAGRRVHRKRKFAATLNTRNGNVNLVGNNLNFAGAGLATN